MRCPDCNKFVSFDEPCVEDVELEINDLGDITCNANVALNCAECGTELKTGAVEMTAKIQHDCDSDERELSIEETMSEGDTRTEGSGRYMKTFYGARVEAKITCGCEHYEEDVELAGHIQASAMDESA